MLGPNDIDDWSSTEEDRLRAEIRGQPVFQAFVRAGRMPPDKVLARRMARFRAGSELPLIELEALLATLKAG